MQRFSSEFVITPETRILDVGGVPDYWLTLAERPRVTLLNMPRTKPELSAAETWVAGDGCSLPFRDQSFDIVFSNSVIEHVGNAAKQADFAREVARVGRSYWVQTPNRWFPVEQHLLTPFIHWLPQSWQSAIVPRFTVWGALAGVSEDRRQFYLQHFLRDIRLLGTRDLRVLFPGSRLIRERFLGITKSLVAMSRNCNNRST